MLTIGTLFLCTALLAFAALSLLCSRPIPPRWTRRRGVAELVTMILTSLMVLGLSGLGTGVGAFDGFQTSIKPLDLAASAVVLAGTVVLWRQLRAHERAAQPGAAAPVIRVTRAPGHAPGAMAANAPGHPPQGQRAA